MRNSEDLGKLILRVTIAVLMLFHGVAKIGHLGGVVAIMGKNGIPEIFAYTVYIGEILAPVMLIIGFRVRTAALLVSATLVGASIMAFPQKIFALGKYGEYALELQALYIFAGIAIFFLGKDKFTLDAVLEKKTK